MLRRGSCAMLVRPIVRLKNHPRLAVGSVVIAGLLLTASSFSQTAAPKKAQQVRPSATQPAPSNSTPSGSSGGASSPAQPAPVNALPANSIVVTIAPPAPTPEQALPQPPVISWDGKDLTIDTENSTLSDILLAVRSRTGASIEMPPSTADERVAIHLGPAPIRDVLSSLLYGTDFNYVIQSSDDDENGLEKVILTAKGEDSSEDGQASTATTASDRKIRLMPGYAAPGKRDFEVAHRKAVEAAQEQDSTAGLTITQDPSSDTSAESAPAAATTDPAIAAPSQSADASTPTSDSGLQLQLAQQTAAGATTPINSSSTSGASSSLNKMEQDLQRMYQQRQQIQAQQNHPQAQGSTN